METDASKKSTPGTGGGSATQRPMEGLSGRHLVTLQNADYTRAGERGGLYFLGAEHLPSARIAALLERPELAGPSIRVRWSDIEPKAGEMPLYGIRNVISAARKRDKTVMLRVLAGQYTPGWVLERMPELDVFYYADEEGPQRMPVPWSAVYLAALNMLIVNLATALRYEAALEIVAVTGGGAGGEPHLPAKDERNLWEAYGYTASKMMTAWATIQANFAAAFGNRVLLTQALATPTVGFGTPLAVLDAIANGAAAHHFAAQINFLDGESGAGEVFAAWDKYPGVLGFQTKCPANSPRFKGTLRQAFQIALNHGAHFGEIYPGDVYTHQADVAWMAEQMRMRDQG